MEPDQEMYKDQGRVLTQEDADNLSDQDSQGGKLVFVEQIDHLKLF